MKRSAKLTPGGYQGSFVIGATHHQFHYPYLTHELIPYNHISPEIKIEISKTSCKLPLSYPAHHLTLGQIFFIINRSLWFLFFHLLHHLKDIKAKEQLPKCYVIKYGMHLLFLKTSILCHQIFQHKISS